MEKTRRSDEQRSDEQRLDKYIALQNDIKKEVCNLFDDLVQRCNLFDDLMQRRNLFITTVLTAFLIIAKYVVSNEPLRDSDGYPLAGLDEVDNAKQSPLISE